MNDNNQIPDIVGSMYVPKGAPVPQNLDGKQVKKYKI